MSFQKKYLLFLKIFGLVLFTVPLNAQSLYWLDASFNSPVIGKSTMYGTDTQTTGLSSSSLPEALAFSTSDNKILWTELKFSGAGIYSTDVNFVPSLPLLSNTSAVRGIAVDPDSNWVYFATSNLQTKPEIDRIHPNGSDKETVIILDSLSGNPRALAFDGVSRYLYWTEFSQGTICRINVDGIPTPQIIVSGLNGPVGLAVDHTGGKIYWTEANSNTINRSSLNGFARVIILSNLSTPNYLTVDTTGGFVYWTEIGTPRIRRATVSGDSIQTLPIAVAHPTGIRFVSQYEALLPVELVSFTGYSKLLNAELKWKTATEQNNYGFEIERSRIQNTEVSNQKKAEQWSKVGFVEGNGTTNTPKEYSFTDKNLSKGKYSYRLKQIDRDGKFSYSHAVGVTFASTLKEFTLEQNYPNPFNPVTMINYQIPMNNHVTLLVYDVLGRVVTTLVNETKEAGSYSTSFDGSKFTSGIYFAKLQSGNKVQMKKMLMIK